MFYSNTEAEFPNWWDALEGQGRESEESEDRDVINERDEYEAESDLDEPSGVSRPVHSSESDGRFVYESGVEPAEGSGTERGRGADDSSSRVREQGGIYGGYGGVGRYEKSVLFQVWEYAEIVPGNDADLWRKDEFGNWIYRLDYGNRNSEFGWEIFDPGVGRNRQGIYVMRPMQWQSFLQSCEFLGG